MGMSSSGLTNREYLPGINVLRGLLSFVVLLWHYQHFWLGTTGFDYTTQPFFKIFQHAYTRGYDAVPIFWLVSGVVLSNAYLRTLTRGQIGDYFVARLARLYPLHLITLFVVAVLQLFGRSAQIYGSNDFKHFFLNMLFVPWWGFEDGYSFNAPIWSVSIEIPVYALFALTIFRAPVRSRPLIIAGLIGVLTVIMNVEFVQTDQLGLKPEFIRCALYFFVGVAVHHFHRSQRPSLDTALLVVSGLALFILASRPSSVLLLTATASASFSISLGRVMPYLGSGPLKVFGDLTYSVFLWHVPVQICIRWILIQSQLENRYFTSPLLLFVYIGSTYLIGYFSHRFIEEPLRRNLRQLSCRSRRAASRAT